MLCLSYLCRLCVDFVLVNFLIISSCVENVIFLVSYRGININKVYKCEACGNVVELLNSEEVIVQFNVDDVSKAIELLKQSEFSSNEITNNDSKSTWSGTSLTTFPG